MKPYVKIFQCNICHFRNIKGKDPNMLIQEDEIFTITIQQELLYAFWIQDPGTVRGNITMLKNWE